MVGRRAVGVGVLLSLVIVGCGQQTSTILEVVEPRRDVPAKPAPLPVAPVCLGIALEACRDNATSAVSNAADTGHAADQIVRIIVRCTGVCTPMNGQGETRVEFKDGTFELNGWGYASGG